MMRNPSYTPWRWDNDESRPTEPEKGRATRTPSIECKPLKNQKGRWIITYNPGNGYEPRQYMVEAETRAKALQKFEDELRAYEEWSNVSWGY